MVDYLATQPRSAALHASRSSLSQLVSTLKEMMTRFLPNEGSAQGTPKGQAGPTSAGQVRISYYEPDRREPELVLYDQAEEVLLSVNEVRFRLVSVIFGNAYAHIILPEEALLVHNDGHRKKFRSNFN